MTNKTVCLIASAAIVLLYSGCANGPLRNWYRGAACNTCQPPVGQPIGCGTNYAPLCNPGTCGSVPANVNPGLETAPVNEPYLEAPGFIPQTSAPYYSSPSAAPVMNETSFSLPTGAISGMEAPPARVFGTGAVKNSWAPPSLGIFRGWDSHN